MEEEYGPCDSTPSWKEDQSMFDMYIEHSFEFEGFMFGDDALDEEENDVEVDSN